MSTRIGVTDRLWEVSDLVALREASERGLERGVITGFVVMPGYNNGVSSRFSIPNPCRKTWADLRGDGRQRHCEALDRGLTTTRSLLRWRMDWGLKRSVSKGSYNVSGFGWYWSVLALPTPRAKPLPCGTSGVSTGRMRSENPVAV
jgi:hypothetical protein